jgi:hypothetical protein
MLAFTWDKCNYMHFFQPHSTPLINESTLHSPKMEFAPYLILSLPTQHEWIYFPDLVQFKDLMLPMQFKPKKKDITMTPH